jgi:hypothetical protein
MHCSHSNVFCASAFFTLPPIFIEQPAGSLPYLQETASDHGPVLNLLTNRCAGPFKGQVLCVPPPAYRFKTVYCVRVG